MRKLDKRSLLILFTLFCGCDSQETLDPQSLSFRQKWLLSAEPEGAKETLDAVEAAKAEPDVAVFGKVGEAESFEPGKATFVLSYEPLAQDHAHADGDNCPFCNRRKTLVGANAIVQFLDDQGTVVSADAQTVLGLKPGQRVVVRGRGTVDPQGILFVAAEGIFIRK